jgi:hypothetical protein
MKVKSLGANKTEIQFSDGRCVLVSYETPVAAFVPGRGWLRSGKRYSVTTSKHVNMWVRDNGGYPALVVPQEEIDAIMNGSNANDTF